MHACGQQQQHMQAQQPHLLHQCETAAPWARTHARHSAQVQQTQRASTHAIAQDRPPEQPWPSLRLELTCLPGSHANLVGTNTAVSEAQDGTYALNFENKFR